MFLPYAVLFACPLLASATPAGADCKEAKYKFGDEYVINECSVWTEDPKVRFKQWTEVKACLTPRGTRIPIGKSVAENGIEYSCVEVPTAKLMRKGIYATRGKRESSTQNLLCKGQYKNGERFNSGNFIKECKSTPNSWYINFVACLTPKKKEIAVGGSATEEGFEYKCTKTDKGTMVQALPIHN